MNIIRFSQEVCTNLDRAKGLEWLETNGLGGFASSTIAGLNTRRYHGLLVAATKPPVGRLVLLSKVEEALIAGGRRFELSANQYPGTVHPRGFVYLTEFRLDPFPVFTFRVENVELEKRVFLVQGENTVVIQYELRGPEGHPSPSCELELRPLIAFRDYHATTHQNGSLTPAVRQEPGVASVRPYADLPELFFSHNATGLDPAGSWYYNFEYDVERERGLDFREDLFNPLLLRFDLKSGQPATLIAAMGPISASSASALCRQEIERRATVVSATGSAEPLVQSLAAAADQFVVQRGSGKTVIAGYPWFSDWGRDTMISLPGLTLVTGRLDVARDMLHAFAGHVDQGMLPNRFPDAGETPEYNTVDATLWFFEAVRAYLHYGGDEGFVRERVYPKLREIVDWHVRGTRYGIRVDGDGLLRCGEPGVQLTWMDAKIGDWVVTPRTGKPVEIQALWYNALRVIDSLSQRFGGNGDARWRDLAERARISFAAQFWNPYQGCLYDCIDGDQRDASVRPNQILAVSLHHSLLDRERAAQVVAVVQRELLTPLGLRTLPAWDSRYRPRYSGGVWERDSAYHQGTVWPWLMGPFITAYLKVHDRSERARWQAAEWLEGFCEHLADAGLGQISEIADAAYPHAPRGCFAQAWSVAELLRAAVEDVYEVRLSCNALTASAV
jgi:predicted glycogen debranching enzyme